MVDNYNTILLAELAKANDYEFKAENGQLVYGPPFNWTDQVPPKNSEVFIGRLPKDIDGRLIVNKFNEIGRIYMFRIMQNFSGLNRGFAFVQYETVQQADEAIRLLNNYEIRSGDRIGVIKSRNNCRLHIGRLDTSLTKEQITAYFNNLTSGIVNITIHKDSNNPDRDTGFAFIEYETHKDAARARRSLKPCKLKLGNKHFTVDWAGTTSFESHFTSSNNIRLQSDSLAISRTNDEPEKDFSHRFSNLVLGHLESDQISNRCSIGQTESISSSTNTGVLVCRNVNPTAQMVELVQIFTVNHSIKVSRIRKKHNSILIYYPTIETALTVLKTFDEIKEEFSICFGEPNKKCELAWLTDLSETWELDDTDYDSSTLQHTAFNVP